MSDAVDRWLRLLAESGPERAAQPRHICDLCVSSLDVSGAGIAMVTATGHRGVVCSTDAVAARIEELQLTLGEGPCVDAALGRSPVFMPDLAEADDLARERWPTFLAAAAAVGVRAIFAFPLRVGAIGVGVLDLYRDSPGPLTARELPLALLAADTAALAVLAVHLEAADALVDDARSGASYQLQVHQATGMVMVQAGVSVEKALLLLRARAYAEDRPLAEVAADVVARQTRFSLEDR